MRLLLVVPPGILAAGGMHLLIAHFSPGEEDALLPFSALLGVVVVLVAWYFTRFAPRCTYVGEDGMATLTLRGRRDAQPSAKVLRFADAAELRASQTRHYLNCVYTGTEYDYRWQDPTGRALLRLKGKYMGQNRPPKAGSPFHFAAAAEVAWCVHYLARAQEQLEREGSIAFRVDSRRVVRVGPGFMEFHFGGEPVRVTQEEIREVSLGNGQFSFVHKDAKWYRSAGKYRFEYGNMANGKVFFLVLEKLMGYSWE